MSYALITTIALEGMCILLTRFTRPKRYVLEQWVGIVRRKAPDTRDHAQFARNTT